MGGADAEKHGAKGDKHASMQQIFFLSPEVKRTIMAYLLLILSYLCGAVPFGLLVGRLKGIDVRQGGSGNIGATNVNRQLGKTLGFLTLLADSGKAVLPMFVADTMLADHPLVSDWVILCGGAAVLGHLFPIYLGFRGGKGVATAFGLLLYANFPAALSLAILFFAVVYLSGYVSAGSLAAAAMMPVVLFFTGADGIQLTVTIVLFLLIWLKHRENIVRLMKGEEKSWKKPTAATERRQP